MSELKPQNLKNHAAFDPWFHIVLSLVLVINLAVATGHLIRHFGLHSVWLEVLSLAVFVLAAKVRMYSIKVQDRVIRLEERQRLNLLLPEAMRSRIPEFTERQLIALRFASDGELPDLAERTLAQNLAPADIKKSIQSWRPDYWRV